MKPLLQDPHPDPAAAISTLATELTDAVSGYKTMADRAEPDLKPTVERLLTLHEAHAAELLELYAEMGGNPETAGSMMGAVHTAIAHARDATGTLDQSARDDILSGERNVLETYTETAEAVYGEPEALKIVTRQRDALEETVNAMQH